MSQAIIDPEEVRRFAAELKRFNGDLRERTASLMARFTALGDTWQDQEQEKFAGEFTWAHLDIAGTAWEEKGRPLLLDRARRRLEDILKTHYPTHVPRHIDEQIRARFPVRLPEHAIRPAVD